MSTRLIAAGALLCAGAAAFAGKAEAPAAAAKRIVNDQVRILGDDFTDEEAAKLPTQDQVWGKGTVIVVDGYNNHRVLAADESMSGALGESVGLGRGKVAKAKVAVAADGKSAWIVAQVKLKQYLGQGATRTDVYRLSELVVEEGGAWRPVVAYWSLGHADKEVHQAFAAGAELAAPLWDGDADTGDAELARLVGDALRGKSLGALVGDRADMVVVGSAPGEELPGKSWKKAWTAWSQTLALEGGVRAGVAPSGTVGWAFATFTIDKQDKKKTVYKIPFRVFLVLEKSAKDGAWRVVHAHLGIAAPPWAS